MPREIFTHERIPNPVGLFCERAITNQEWELICDLCGVAFQGHSPFPQVYCRPSHSAGAAVRRIADCLDGNDKLFK